MALGAHQNSRATMPVHIQASVIHLLREKGKIAQFFRWSKSLRGTTWNNYFSLMATRSQFNHKAIYEAILVVQPVLLETSGALPFCEACALKMRRIYIYIYKHRTC